MFHFDTIIERKNTDSLKWDFCEERLGKKDVLPMWVADMDFASPPEVTEAIIKRAQHGIYGYTQVSTALNQAIIAWNAKRHSWTLQPEWLVHAPGVVSAINTAILTFTAEGDKILIQTPVYYPFYSCICENGRRLVKNPLEKKNGSYGIDFIDLEAQLSQGVRMMLFCSPHNPIGRVWTDEELSKVAALCQRYGVLLVSDEIHSDLVFAGHTHQQIARQNPWTAENCITLNSPTKTFNIAGLSHSFAVITNPALRKKYEKTMHRTGADMLNLFGLTATLAAYTHGEAWLEALMLYLTDNLNFLVDYFEKKIPEIQVIRPESTYLAWLDCSGLAAKTDNVKAFFIEKAKVGMNEGSMFGTEGKGYWRINFACPRATLISGLQSIENAVKQL